MQENTHPVHMAKLQVLQLGAVLHNRLNSAKRDFIGDNIFVSLNHWSKVHRQMGQIAGQLAVGSEEIAKFLRGVRHLLQR